MARSTEEIFNGMVARKEQLASLVGYTPNGLANSYQYVLQQMNSKSKVALWLQIFFVIAEAVHTSEVLWDYFSKEVDERIAAHKPGTKLWYKQQALNFQYGDQLVYLNEKYQYLILDDTKKIVAQASVNDNGGVVRIKAARSDGNGGLQKLTSLQVFSLAAYFVKIRYAGTKTVAVSFDPDTIKLWFVIKYDALVEMDALQIAVKEAVKVYLKSLPFDGRVILSAVVDSIQAVPGVTDVVVRGFYGTYGNVGDFDRTVFGDYATNAGYAVHDENFFDQYTTFEAEEG